MAIYAVLGSGTMTRKNTVALLKDHLNEGDEIYLAATDLDDAGRFAADWALDNKIGVVIFRHKDQHATLVDYAAADIRTVPEDDPDLSRVVLNGLKIKNGTLWFAYDEREPQGQSDFLEEALRAGISVCDLTSLLHPITLDDEVDEPADEAQQPAAPLPAPIQANPRSERRDAEETLAAERESGRGVLPPDLTMRDAISALKPIDVSGAIPSEPVKEVHTMNKPWSDEDLAEHREVVALGNALKTILDYLKK